METHWNLPPPPGFQGLCEDLPLTVYRQHLPHWRQDGATYFVTFRLEDSLPQSKLRELEFFKAEWERRRPPPRSRDDEEELTREVMRRMERWLDQDGATHELDCYVVMPNHIHAIVRPLTPKTLPLEKVLQRWKGGSSCEINRHLHRSGTLWQQESFDRIIRDEEHLWRCVQYIGRNPQYAGLSPGEVALWIRPSWMELGWRFEPS